MVSGRKKRKQSKRRLAQKRKRKSSISRRVKRKLFAIPRRIMQPNRTAPGDELGLMPKTKTVTLYYCNDFVVPGNAVPGIGYINYQYSVNGCFNPEIQIAAPGEHQPRLFDQYMANYTNYEVLGSKIMIKQVTGSTTDAQLTADVSLSYGSNKQYVGANSDAGTTGGGMHAMLCERGVKLTTAYSLKNDHVTFNQKPFTLTASWSLKKAKRQLRKLEIDDAHTDEDWKALAFFNPQHPASHDLYYNFMITSAHQLEGIPELSCKLMIAYRVRFSNVVAGTGIVS